MKTLKRLSGVLLAVLMVMAMAIPAFAAQTESLTINGTTAGKTYDLYKVLDLTQSGDAYSYTVNADFENFSTTAMGDKDLVAYIKDASTSDLSNLAKELVAYAVEHKIAPAQSVEATGTSETASLDYGYYVMNPRGGSGASGNYATMFSLNTLSGKNTTINVKAEYPSVEKKVDNAEVSEASIGDDVTFTLTSKVPDLTGYKWYKFVAVDTLSAGLDYEGVTSITVGGTEIGEDAYTVDTTGGQTIRFVLKDLVAAGYTEGADIVITYKATLNADAEIGTANDNTAKIEYSNDPSYTQENEPTDDDFETDEPKGESGKSKTETYTTALTLNKVDGNDNALTGAEFQITGDGVKQVLTVTDTFEENANGEYWKLTDGTYTTNDPNAEGMDQSKYADTETKYTKKTTSTLKGAGQTSTDVKAFVGEDGKLTFAGLGAGEYTITETTTPDGYNSIQPIKVTIAFSATDKTFSATANNNTISAVDNTLSMDVVNNSGNVLPSTGGMGTTIFYVVGGILVIGAGVVLVSKKRMGAVK